MSQESRKQLVQLQEENSQLRDEIAMLRVHLNSSAKKQPGKLHVSRNGLLLCVQFVFTALNNSLLFLVPLRELSQELRVINYNLRKILGLTN